MTTEFLPLMFAAGTLLVGEALAHVSKYRTSVRLDDGRDDT